MSTEYETTVDATVRTATEDDAEEIMALWNGYAETLADYDERFRIEEGGREKWRTYFTTSLVESSRGDILLAEDGDGEVVGALEARVVGGHPVFNFGKHGQVYGHYVHEAYRDADVGRALLKAAEDWFREREMDFWRIDVLHAVAESAVYESFGMRPMEAVYEKEL